MTGLLLTKSTMPIIGPIASLLGYIMDAIYTFLDQLFSIQNIGLSIILFTFIIYLFLLPLTIKQQKFSKMSAKMNPEIQALQKKYKNKKDQASVMKMQEEMKAIYEKYGTSPTGGCLQLVIQMPILLALYQVIINIPAYVGNIRDAYMPLVNGIMGTDGFQKIMEKIGSASPVMMSADKFDYTKADTLVGVLYKFQQTTWDALADKFPQLGDLISNTVDKIGHMNNFLGINIAEAPFHHLASAAILIPILAGVTQWINVKLMPSPTAGNDDNNTMASSMKMMNMMMPIMSMVFCFTLPAGLGLYWIAGAVFRSIQQVLINKHFDKIDMDELIEKNREKAKKKRQKKGLPADTVSSRAKMNVRNIEEPKKNNSGNSNKKIDYNADANPGSLASKANMVRKFNEANKKK